MNSNVLFFVCIFSFTTNHPCATPYVKREAKMAKHPHTKRRNRSPSCIRDKLSLAINVILSFFLKNIRKTWMSTTWRQLACVSLQSTWFRFAIALNDSISWSQQRRIGSDSPTHRHILNILVLIGPASHNNNNKKNKRNKKSTWNLSFECRQIQRHRFWQPLKIQSANFIVSFFFN